MFKEVGTEDYKYIENIVGKERVLFKDEIGEDYCHDELGGIFKRPDILVKVKSTEEISKIMSYANKEVIPVVVRGSGTGLVGASVAMHGGIMLDMSGMNHILELDEENLIVTIEPGVLLMELSKFCEEHDFFYPPDPGEKSATIGGNISTNAGGMRAVKYGVTREYVRGLTAVLPTGEVIKVGGKVVKNSTGYSIKDLLIGSEGTLAVITEAMMRLLPLPKISISLLVPFKTVKEAIEAVPAIVKSKASLVAIEFFEKETLGFSEEYLGKKFPDTNSEAYLLLSFDGNNETAVNEELDRVAELCLSLGAKDSFIVDTDERKASVWTPRGAFLEAIKASTTEMDECDVVVPRNRIADFILYTHELSKEYKIRIPSFGHAGDGNLHIYICRDDYEKQEWEEKKDAVFKCLYERANELKGLVSGEHGIGYAKKEYMKNAIGADQYELMKRIKASFDPNGILNPGKLF